jgi:hypothetical protein
MNIIWIRKKIRIKIIWTRKKILTSEKMAKQYFFIRKYEKMPFNMFIKKNIILKVVNCRHILIKKCFYNVFYYNIFFELKYSVNQI